MTTVGVVIATYGNRDEWKTLAHRAKMSAQKQTHEPDDLVWIHGESLHGARNLGAEELSCDRTIFLDADDELDPRYIEKMLEVEGDIIQPSTLGVVGDKRDPFPVLIPEKSLIDGNYIVIGAMLNTELFLQVGGFQDWPLYEDWDLWLRMFIAGALIAKQPEAIYIVHVNTNGRNSPERAHQLRYYNEIRARHLVEYQAVRSRRS